MNRWSDDNGAIMIDDDVRDRAIAIARWCDDGAKAGWNILRWSDREYDGDDVRTMIMERWHNEEGSILYRVIISALLCHDHRIFSFYSHIRIPYPTTTDLITICSQMLKVSSLSAMALKDRIYNFPNTPSSEMQEKWLKRMIFLGSHISSFSYAFNTSVHLGHKNLLSLKYHKQFRYYETVCFKSYLNN